MSAVHEDIKIGSTTVGGADIYYEEDGIWLGNFEIFDKYRGKGFASDALRSLISKYKIDSLVVAQNNAIAVHLYKKFGFKIVQSYYAEDLDADVYYMKRDASNDIVSI